MNKLETTLLYLRKNDEILLAKKKRGFAKDKYKGVGGKVENGETPEEAAIRECKEEISVKPTKYEKVGIIEYDEYYKGKREQITVHVYISDKWTGEPKESDEMFPKWFNINSLPYDEMIGDDPYWLPLVLEGKKVKGFFQFSEDWKIIKHEVKVKEELYVKDDVETRNV